MTNVESEVKTPVDLVKQEKERLLVLVLKNRAKMVSDYKNTIRHTGGLLTTSMTYAYSKGINDILKLLTKETK